LTRAMRTMKTMKTMTMTRMTKTRSSRGTRACWTSRRRRAEVRRKKSRMKSDDRPSVVVAVANIVRVALHRHRRMAYHRTFMTTKLLELLMPGGLRCSWQTSPGTVKSPRSLNPPSPPSGLCIPSIFPSLRISTIHLSFVKRETPPPKTANGWEDLHQQDLLTAMKTSWVSMSASLV
jgi:hypothetical protein